MIKLISFPQALLRPIHDWAMTLLARFHTYGLEIVAGNSFLACSFVIDGVEGGKGLGFILQKALFAELAWTLSLTLRPLRAIHISFLAMPS